VARRIAAKTSKKQQVRTPWRYSHVTGRTRVHAVFCALRGLQFLLLGCYAVLVYGERTGVPDEHPKALDVKRTVHIIASCTDRKRLAVQENLAFGDARDGSGDHFTRWWKAITEDGSATLPAAELYIGDHWSIVRGLPEVARASNLNAHLWVASAGYGLVPADAHLHAYAATFSPGHADSVVDVDPNKRVASAREWWKRLADAPNPPGKGIRTIAALARSAPTALLLVVASPRYVVAMEDDLCEARVCLRKPGDLLIVSGSPGPETEALKDCWLHSSAALQAVLGGALGSLHARVARRILEDAAKHGLDAKLLRAQIIELARQQFPFARPERKLLEDKDVISFIKKELMRDSSATHTRLLRALRNGGRACEQGPFPRLFRETKGT